MQSPSTPSHLPDLEIRLLSRFRVHVAGRAIPAEAWRLRKARDLLAILALRPDRSAHSGELMEILWPGFAGDRARNNLRKMVHVARRALASAQPAGAELLVRRGDLLCLAPGDAPWIDVVDFERAAADARRVGTLEALRAATDLYTGELLPDCRYQPWREERADSLARLHRSLLRGIARHLEAAGDTRAAIEALERVVSTEPLDEEAHAALMRLHARTGDRGAALRQFERLRSALLETLGTEPMATTRDLHAAILAGHVASDAGSVAAAAADEAAAPPLGRDREMGLLDGALGDAFAGKGTIILLSGEAGIGKTRLASELLRRAASRGALALRGAAYEHESQVAYGPISEALDDYARHAASDEAAWIGDHLPALAPLMPSLAVRHAPPDDAAGDGGSPVDRGAFLAAVRRFLEHLTAVRPVLLVLDDLHAADGATLELLHYLGRLARDLRLLVVGTCRADAVSAAALLPLVGAMSRERLCRPLQLEQLERRFAEELLARAMGSAPDEPSAEHIFGLTAGNPLYLLETARALREEDWIEAGPGGWHLRSADPPIFGRLQDLVAGRVSRLSPEARRVLDVMAVVGREAPLAVLRDLSQAVERDLLAAIEECVEAGLLAESPGGLRFRHPLHREVLYDRLVHARRASLHRRAAERILAEGDLTGDAAERLAHHWLHSDEPGRAIPHLLAAAERAESVHANELALDLYDRVLAALGTARVGDEAGRTAGGGAGRMAAEVYEKIGDLRTLVSNPIHGLDPYRQALSAHGDRADPGMLARLHRKAAAAHLATHDAPAAEPHIAAAEAHLAAVPRADEGARVHCLRTQWLWETGQLEEARRAVERSVELADLHGTASDRAAAHENFAAICHFLGDWREGLHREMQRLTLEADNPQLARVFGIHHCIAQFQLYSDRDFASTERYARQTIELAVQLGARRAEAFARCLLGEALLLRGSWNDAAASLRRSVDLYLELGVGPVALPWQRLAETAIYRGHFEAADEYLRRATAALAGEPMAPHLWGRIHATEALAALERGDPERALEAIEAAHADARRFGSCFSCDVLLHPVAAEAHALAGDLDHARARAEAARRVAKFWESAAWRGMAEAAQASIASAQGDAAGAADHLRSASTLFDRADQPFWSARCLRAAGAAAAIGDPAAASTLLSDALSRFEQLGALHAETLTRAAIAALGPMADGVVEDR